MHYLSKISTKIKRMYILYYIAIKIQISLLMSTNILQSTEKYSISFYLPNFLDIFKNLNIFTRLKFLLRERIFWLSLYFGRGHNWGSLRFPVFRSSGSSLIPGTKKFSDANLKRPASEIVFIIKTNWNICNDVNIYVI